MEKEKKDLNLRSDEIQDIMQRTPSWIIRWGITTIFMIILLGLLLCWLIRYPEIISGPVRLSTSNPPVKIISQTSGKMTTLYVKDGEMVKAGAILAEIENPLSAEGVTYIQSYLTQLDQSIRSGQQRLPIPDTSGLVLGDLQTVFNDLQKAITAFNLQKVHRVDEAEIAEIRKHIAHEEELLAINLRMIEIHRKELENATRKYEADQNLYNNKVISKNEFYLRQTEYNNKQLQLEQLEQSRVQYQVALNNLKLQLSQSQFTKDTKSQGNLETIQLHQKTIQGYLVGWQQKFRLTAVKDGRVSFLLHLQANQFLKAGEEVMALFAPEDSIVGYAEVPVAGFGKVKAGQDVHLLMDNYPHYDYGTLQGKVRKIALLPNSNFYRVEISLPDGMKSSQNKDLTFTPEMIGIAEIITDDKTVLERIFKSILKLFDQREEEKKAQ